MRKSASVQRTSVIEARVSLEREAKAQKLLAGRTYLSIQLRVRSLCHGHCSELSAVDEFAEFALCSWKSKVDLASYLLRASQ